MFCPKCNVELDANSRCPHCGYTANMNDDQDVQTMSNREARNYDGITIEEESNYRKETKTTQQSQQSAYNYNKRPNSGYYRSRNSSGVKVRYINLGNLASSNMSWLTKGIIALGGIAVLAFFFFVALPVLLTLVGVGIVAWIIFRFFRR